MPADVAELQIRVLSDQVDQATRRLEALERSGKNAGKQTDAMGSSMEKTMRRYAAGAISIGAVTAAVSTGIKQWNEYDVAIKEVGSITTQTAGEFQTMRRDVLELSVAMGVDATTAAKGLYEAMSAGIPKENAITFLATASKAAVAGVTDVKTAVNVLTNVINAYKVPVTEADTISDKLFATIVAGKTTMEELSSSMAQGTVPAAALGIKLDELLAAVIAITQQGTPTSEAFTQITSVITSLLNPSEEMTAALKQMGYESGRAAIAALGFGETMQQLRNVVGSSDATFVKAFGRVEAFKGVLSTTGENLQFYKNGLDAVVKSSGDADKAFETNANTLNNALNSLKASFIGLVEMFESKTSALKYTGELLHSIANGISIISGDNNVGDTIQKASGGTELQQSLILQRRMAELQKQKTDLELQLRNGGSSEVFLGQHAIFGDPAEGQLKQTITDMQRLQVELDRQAETTNRIAAAWRTLEEAKKGGDPKAAATAQLAYNAILDESVKIEEKRAKELQEKTALEAQNKAAEAEKLAQLQKANELKTAENKLADEDLAKAKQLATSEREIAEAQITRFEALKKLRPEQAAMMDEAIAKLREQLQLLDEAEAKKFGLPTISGDMTGKLDDPLLDSHRDRGKEILEITRDTEEQRGAIIRESDEKIALEAQQAIQQRQREQLTATAEFFGNMAALSRVGGGEAFKIGQAFAIAQATVSMYQSAVSAYAQGAAISPFLGPVFAGGALVAGAANIAQIRAQKFNAYAQGGMIGAGHVGLVGEAGPEFVRGPAVVTSANATRGLRNGPSNSGSNAPTIIINNLPGQTVETRHDPEGNSVEFTVKKTLEVLAGQVNSGTGNIFPTFAKKHGITRKGV